MSAKGVAIITGAAQGIGRAIVVRLAADGFDVAVNDLPNDAQVAKLTELAEEIRATGRKAILVPGDVSQEAVVEKMVTDAVEQLGGVDVMVANAGICELSPIVSTTVEQWDATQATNLRGVFLCFKHAGKQMLAQGRPGASSAVAPSVASLVSRWAAPRELGPNGITVNSYAPGIVATPLTVGNYGQEFLDSQKATCAINDNGTPEDIAALVSFLASKESRFITGQTIMIDGGRLNI
ncbi:hypothetical protein EWM64_g7643 [Hericium alpestre]|uniref:3-oxoacyl-[acyl-carrier-protein] reductase n=1 Tax=Hericium alpestre TaxID=135208 RepID=A0A4Y9ZQ46_9AGAM|nr:hypothetical protein EWM64_g7643 [Hericium alpestre]